jgi:uncharacterized membrane protein
METSPDSEPDWFTPPPAVTAPTPSVEPAGSTAPPPTSPPSPQPKAAPHRRTSGPLVHLPPSVRRWVPWPSATVWGIALVALVETAILSWIQWQNYLGFHSRQGDFGNYSQAFWTTVHGQGFFAYTANIVGGSNGTLWAVHFLPTLVLLVPFYAVAPSPLALIVLKQAALALGAIPVYGIARAYFPGKYVPLLFAGLYLLSPLTIATDWNNFDPESFIPLTVLVALYFFTVGRYWPFLIAWLLALGTIESTPPLLILFAIGALLGTFLFPSLSPYWTARQQRRPLFVALIVAVVFLGVAFLFLQELGRGGGFSSAYAVRYTILGAPSFPDVPLQAATHPARAILALKFDEQLKVLFVVMLFLASGAISILGGLRYLLPVVGYLALALLSNNATLFVFGSQYPAMLAPFLFVGAIEGAALLWDYFSGLDPGHRHRELALRLSAEARAVLARLTELGLDPAERRQAVRRLDRVVSMLAWDQLGAAQTELRHLRRELGIPRGGLTSGSAAATPGEPTGPDGGAAASPPPRPRSGRPNLWTGLKAAIFAVLVISILVASAYANPLLSHPAAGGPQVAFGYQPATPQADALHSVLELLPPEASVLTTSHIFPEVSDRPNAYVVNNATGLPGSQTPNTNFNLTSMSNVPGIELPNQDLDHWLNMSQFLALDYWVDPANAVIYRNLANLSGFGVYAEEDGAVLYERGWSGVPVAWSPWTDTWAGSDFATHNGSSSELYASPAGPSYYHPAGNSAGGSLWGGPRFLYLPPGNYSATFDMELEDAASKTPHIKLEVVETPSYFEDYIVDSYSGYSFNNVTIHAQDVPAHFIAMSHLATTPIPQLEGMNVTLTFDWTTPGFVSFTGTELSPSMSVYLTSVSVEENYPLP